MIPLRFKAVCTETGREFGIDEMCCGGYVRDKKDYPIGLYWSVEFEGMVLGRSNPKIQLCQSTGLRDANGQEVFFGDLLISLDRTCMFEVDFLKNSIVIKNPVSGLQQTNAEIFGVLTVIGNRWEPAETLKERVNRL